MRQDQSARPAGQPDTPVHLPPVTLVVWLLGISQVAGYGTLYYAFAILAGDMADEFHWSVSWIFGAFSLALLAGGLLSPVAGRWVDRFGAPVVMTFGSIGAAAALVVVAFAPNIWIYLAGLGLIEMASAFVLYNAAFACLVQCAGPDAGRRISHLTLIAGFASTLFWPLTSWLHAIYDWRQVILLFAAMQIGICLPIHFYLFRRLPADRLVAPAGLEAREPAIAPLPPEKRRRALLLASAGFSLSGFVLGAILTQMVPLLTTLGLGASAVIVSTVFGPAQVLVRLVNLAAGTGRHPLTVTLIAAAMLPLAVAILALTAPWAIGATVFALLFGFGSGLNSIVRGTLPLALFGREAYGATLGRMSAAMFISNSVAPFALMAMMEATGPAVALSVMIAIGLAGLVSFLAIRRL